MSSEIDKLVNSVWKKNSCLKNELSQSLYVSIRKAIKLILVSNRDISLLPTACKTASNILLSSLTPYAADVIGDQECLHLRKMSATDYLFFFLQTFKQKLGYSKQCISYLYIYD
jgi:hypothetical protein